MRIDVQCQQACEGGLAFPRSKRSCRPGRARIEGLAGRASSRGNADGTARPDPAETKTLVETRQSWTSHGASSTIANGTRARSGLRGPPHGASQVGLGGGAPASEPETHIGAGIALPQTIESNAPTPDKSERKRSRRRQIGRRMRSAGLRAMSASTVYVAQIAAAAPAFTRPLALAGIGRLAAFTARRPRRNRGARHLPTRNSATDISALTSKSQRP